MFFLQGQTIFFQINNSTVIQTVQLSRVFPALKSTRHFMPSPACLVGKIEVQDPFLLVVEAVA